MSKLIEPLVRIPDEVYDNAKILAERTGTSVEAVLSVAIELDMPNVARLVSDVMNIAD